MGSSEQAYVIWSTRQMAASREITWWKFCEIMSFLRVRLSKSSKSSISQSVKHNNYNQWVHQNRLTWFDLHVKWQLHVKPTDGILVGVYFEIVNQIRHQCLIFQTAKSPRGKLQLRWNLVQTDRSRESYTIIMLWETSYDWLICYEYFWWFYAPHIHLSLSYLKSCVRASYN